MVAAVEQDEFYLRYYMGHKGKFEHEFLEFCYIIVDNEIMKEDDNSWPDMDRIERQELEIIMGNEHISFITSNIGSLVDVQNSKDPDGLHIFYYLIQI